MSRLTVNGAYTVIRNVKLYSNSFFNYSLNRSIASAQHVVNLIKIMKLSIATC